MEAFWSGEICSPVTHFNYSVYLVMLLQGDNCHFRLGEEYQAISDKALSLPENTADLMALIKYVDQVETKTLFEMEDRLRDVMGYILFLSDYVLFTPVEMKQNNIAFQW